MNPLIDLPEHEQFISSFAVDTTQLSLRVASDFHVGYEAKAYVVAAQDLQDADGIAAFLRAASDAGDYIYLTASGSSLLLQKEDGESFLLEAGSVFGKPDELNAKELRSALDRVTEWYLADDVTIKMLNDRLEGVRSLLNEQARRVELKSASHPADSIAGVLYAQQMQMIHRLLKVSEG